MPITRYNPRHRYRQKSHQRMAAVFWVCVVGFVVGGLGYAGGYQTARMDLARLKDDIESIRQERDTLQQSNTRLLADRHSVTLKYEEMASQLKSEVPSEGPLKDIITKMREQLEAGVAPERLAEAVRTLSPPRNCSEVEVRRFLVSTLSNSGGKTGVTIADGALVIRATGEPAKNKQGKDETWYDPARPVALSFEWKSDQGPKTLDRSGNLPLSQVVTTGGREYRLTFSESAKSFIKVSFDSCEAM